MMMTLIRIRMRMMRMIICETTFDWPFDLNSPELENYKKDCLDAFVVLCDDDEGDEDDKYDEDDEDDYL